MQHALVVLLDDDAGVEELSVHRPAGEVEQHVLDFRLQDQRHHHAPRGRVRQRAPEGDPGKEIRVGNDDFALGAADRREIRLLDVAAVAQVVADHELRRLRSDALGVSALRKERQLARAQLHELHQRPHALHGLRDQRQQRAFHADREIEPRRLLARRVHVVDDVDAADERDAAIDVDELAVQAAQPVRAELPGGDFGPVLEHLDARVAHEARERRSEVELRAPAVDHHPDLDATLRSARHRLGYAAAARIVGKEVALEPDFALGRIDRALERRKIFGPAPEQLDPIAGTEAIHGISVGTRALRARGRRSPRARRGRTVAPEGTRSARRWRRPTARANRCDRA